MAIAQTYLSLHNIDSIAVVSDPSHDAQLVLTIEGRHGTMRIVVFMAAGTDMTYTKRLADAMRAVPLELPAEPDPDHTAAHDAASHYSYKGLDR